MGTCVGQLQEDKLRDNKKSTFLILRASPKWTGLYWEGISFAIEQKGLENFLWLRQGFNAEASPKSGSIVEFLELQVRVREP